MLVFNKYFYKKKEINNDLIKNIRPLSAVCGCASATVFVCAVHRGDAPMP
jgi:hypothetical protein